MIDWKRKIAYIRFRIRKDWFYHKTQWDLKGWKHIYNMWYYSPRQYRKRLARKDTK